MPSSRYREQLNDNESTALANRFLCAALAYEEAGDSLEAAWMATGAAWVSDDENDWKSSQRARVSAVARFIRAVTEPPAAVKWRRPDAVLLTDLLRRAAQFDDAYVTCKDGLAEEESASAGILRYEESLILARDAGACTFHEVRENVEDYLVAAGYFLSPPPS
jgi:hypothetical protein